MVDKGEGMILTDKLMNSINIYWESEMIGIAEVTEK